MSDLVQALRAETGLDDDQISGGLGALLDFLKKQLPPELFTSVESALPQAAALLQAFALKAEGATAEGGGLLGSLGDLAGKIFGGKAGDLAELSGGLSKVGLSLEQIKDFVPKALALLKRVLPDDLLEKILAAVPALAGLLKPATE